MMLRILLEFALYEGDSISMDLLLKSLKKLLDWLARYNKGVSGRHSTGSVAGSEDRSPTSGAGDPGSPASSATAPTPNTERIVLDPLAVSNHRLASLLLPTSVCLSVVHPFLPPSCVQMVWQLVRETNYLFQQQQQQPSAALGVQVLHHIFCALASLKPDVTRAFIGDSGLCVDGIELVRGERAKMAGILGRELATQIMGEGDVDNMPLKGTLEGAGVIAWMERPGAWGGESIGWA